MKVTPSVIQHEFIGLETKVIKSSNPSYEGLAGTIVNETRNTFIIRQNNKRRTIVKNYSIFHFTLPDATVVEIDGKTLVGRPEERLKKQIRRLW